MVVVDIVVLSVWQGVDPLERTLEVFPLEVPKNTVEDIKIKPELEHCESRHNTIWLGKCVGVCGHEQRPITKAITQFHIRTKG